MTTGISAHDRARTIQVAIDPATKPSDLARPGHMFPLRARKGGVLVRAGQTEASVDLARLAGMVPAGIICEIMKDDGSMARVPDLIEFCREHKMKMLTVAELIRYRMAHERYVHRVGEALIDTRFGEFRMIAYESEVDGGESHVALIRGDIEHSRDPGAGAHACALPDGRRVRRDRVRMPRYARRRAAAHCAGRMRSADLSAPDVAGILGGESRRTECARLSSGTEASGAV